MPWVSAEPKGQPAFRLGDAASLCLGLAIKTLWVFWAPWVALGLAF